MKSTWFLVFVAVLLSGAGLFASDKLLSKHMRAPGMPAWVDALCGSGGTGTVSCDVVLSSKWGVFPPAEPDDSKQRSGIPVALLGFAYFAILLVWFAAVGRPNRSGRFWHLVPLVFNAVGIVASAGFIWIMAFKLRTWCPLCISAHVVNFLLFVVNVLLWPRATKGSGATDHEPAVAERKVYPSTRHAMVSALLALAFAQIAYQSAILAPLRRANRQLNEVVEEVRSNAQALITMHLNSPWHEIVIRTADPIRYDGKGTPLLVVWTDFQCKHCKKFAKDFESTYRSEFGDFIRMIFKHYPADKSCNPYQKVTLHPNACNAAKLAEAVRIVGGKDKFWEVYDILFDAPDMLMNMNPRAIAIGLGMDPDEVIRVMKSDEVMQRISADIEQGHGVGVSSTPGVFVNGRVVNSVARSVDDFWRYLGGAYQKKRVEWEAQQQVAEDPDS